MSKFRDWRRARIAEGNAGYNKQRSVANMARNAITSALWVNRAGELRRAGKLNLARGDIEYARAFRLNREQFPQVVA